MHLVYPRKFCIVIIFDFSWDGCYTREKLESMVIPNVRGLKKVHYGLGENSEWNNKRLNAKTKTPV